MYLELSAEPEEREKRMNLPQHFQRCPPRLTPCDLSIDDGLSRGGLERDADHVARDRPL